MAKKKFFYGWFIVLGGAIAMALVQSLMNSCSSIYVPYITEDLGFTRSALAIMNTLISVVTMFLSPYMGKWLSKFSIRKIQTTCMIAFAFFYAGYSFCNSLPQFYILSFILGVCSCGAGMLPVSIMITNWFQKKRGLAMSIALAGSGLGGSILSPLITGFIQQGGWRSAYLYIAIIFFVLEVPVALFLMRKQPSDMGLLPYGAEEAAAQVAAGNPASGEVSLSLKEARQHPFFWLFVFGIFCLGLVGGGSLIQLPPYLKDIYDAGFAAKIISAYLLVAVPGKIVLGWIYDKFGAKLGSAYVCTVFALSFVCLLFPGNQSILYPMAVFYGLGTCIGTVTPSVVTSAMFGPKFYGEVYGFVSLFLYAGIALGVPAIALIYDMTGSYRSAWILCIALCAITLACLWMSYNACHRTLRQKDDASITGPAAR